jgi:CHAT domain-containing protein
LWSVGDESTKELMVEFYSKLASGASKAEALQSAEIKLLKNPKFSRPLYWAPFVLMGDWR